MDLSQHFQIDSHSRELHLLEEALSLYGLSTVDILTLQRENPGKTAEALSSKLGKPISQCRQLLECFERISSEELVPLYKIPIKKYVSTSISQIDSELHGGFPVGQVSEVFGASGTGKSQFLLNLAINSQKLLNEKGASAECIYITTEAPMETRRLVDFSKPETDLSNISCIHCIDMENQDHIIFTQLRAKLILSRNSGSSIGAIIIDSISHHLRASETYLNSIEYLRNHLESQESELVSDPLYAALKMEFDKETNKFFRSDRAYKLRAAKELYLLQLYKYLDCIARDFQVAIIVANQISDILDYEEIDAPLAERFDPLNYEFQVGTFSGWDAPAFGPFESEQLEKGKEFQRNGQISRGEIEILQLSSGNTSTQLPYLLPKTEALEVKFEGSTLNRRKRIPALGYTWSKLIPHRILLWKKYQWNTNLQPFSGDVIANGHSAGEMNGKINGENQERDTIIQNLTESANTQNQKDDYEQFSTHTNTKVRRFARVISPLVHSGSVGNIEFEILHKGLSVIT